MSNNAYDYVPATFASKIPPLYGTEKMADPTVWLKWFTPDSNYTFFLTEYDPQERRCFGLVVGHETELGYFSLEELEEVRGPLGLRMERDLHFTPKPLSEVRQALDERGTA